MIIIHGKDDEELKEEKTKEPVAAEADDQHVAAPEQTPLEEPACAAGAAPIARSPITADQVQAAHEAFAADPTARIAKNAASSTSLRTAARVPEAVARVTNTFDVQLEQGDITDQKRSGRCWMFASLNTMRFRVMKKLNLKTFELSQAYPLFWDKYERSAWFLDNILATAEQPTSSREVSFLLADPVGDGGQWDMFKALVKKYGVVPKEAMPETQASSNTGDLDAYLTRYLRAGAKELREAVAAGEDANRIAARRANILQGVYRVLAICLGEPPACFEARIRDKDDKLVVSGTYTPQQFFEDFVDMELDDYVSVINAPTADKPYGRSYTVKFLGNVAEGGGVRYVNLPIERLKEAAVAQLQDGLPVWFGCDVDQSYSRADCLMDPAALDIDGLLGLPVMAGLDKAGRLDYGESLMTHAMVFQGVNLDSEGKPTLWRVENSWGDDRSRKGWDIMSDEWFSEYVYQVVVDKKYLTEEERAAYDSEAIELAPWDPLGALAD